MSDSNSVPENNLDRDVGGIICSVLFLTIGAVCLYETTKMVDPDSFLFPRLVIFLLIGLSALHIFTALKKNNKPAEEALEGDVAPSNPRRILIVAAMIGSALLMPVVGFLIAGLAAFIALMLLSNYDPWTSRTSWLYPLVGVIIVCGFFWIFSTLLHVPLPEGSLINIAIP